MRIITTLFLGAVAAMAAPALAASKTDTLAACMWAKMPTTTAAFVESNGPSEFSLFMKAAAECDPADGTLNLKGLKKKLAATRPAAIGPDLGMGEGAYVCPRSSDGTIQDCKPAGE
jgi:hypothetical protein